MALEIAGKTALVTGGASGICREFVKKLVAGGCNVTIADLNPGPDDDGAGEIAQTSQSPGQTMFVQTDVTNWDQLQNAFDKTIERFGRLDIVCPGAGVFEPPFSNFWHFNKGTDTNASSSFKTLDINVTHPIRATQLAIDAFQRQKLNHGVVVHVSSVAAQAAVLPAPIYAASKHAVSGFVRSLADLERSLNIRVNAVAPGRVKTPLWTADKLEWVDEDAEPWVTTEKVAQTMLDLVTKPENVGGTVLEVGVDVVRSVQELNDPGPQGRGHAAKNVAAAVKNVYGLIEENFGV